MSGFDLSQYTPAELGLPEKFDQFRPCQVEAVEWAADQERRRFVGLGLPPGSGKSLIAAALAKVTGMRTAVLTATKALQEQYAADFLDLVDIRGKANYRCADKANVSCRFGAHEGCRLAGGLGCGYEEARARARKAQVVVTNYAYWIRANAFGRGLEPDPKEGGEPRPVELLVLDECHAAERELSNALRVVVRESWLRDAGVLDETDPARRRSEDVGEWAKAAKELGAWVKVRFEAAVKELRRRPTSAGREKVYVLEELVEALGAVGKMRGAEWVCEMKQGTKWGRCWEFDCVWPGQWAEGRLFVGTPKVVLMSGTLHPSVFGLLGVKKEEREFREWPRVFPAQNTPIWHVKSGVRVNRHVTDEGVDKVVELIDRIIDANTSNGAGPRKGLVQTVSYQNQKRLLERSRHRGIMLANTQDPESDTAQEVAKEFRESEGPRVLVSPSFGMGWDFRRRQCEFIILFKVPYPDMRPKVMVERMSRSKTYGDQIAAQTMVQSSLRGTRDELDRCNVYIMDDGVVWFLRKNKHLVPGEWRVMTVGEVPEVGRRCPA